LSRPLPPAVGCCRRGRSTRLFRAAAPAAPACRPTPRPPSRGHRRPRNGPGTAQRRGGHRRTAARVRRSEPPSRYWGLIAPVDPKATPFELAHDVLADLVPAADPRALPLLPEDPRPALVDTVTSPEALMATAVPAEAALAGPRKRRRRLHGFGGVIGVTMPFLQKNLGLAIQPRPATARGRTVSGNRSGTTARTPATTTLVDPSAASSTIRARRASRRRPRPELRAVVRGRPASRGSAPQTQEHESSDGEAEGKCPGHDPSPPEGG